MTQIRWRWQSAAGVPRIAERRAGRFVATAFGKWLAERIASLSIDFPVIAFHEVVLGATGVELALLAPDRDSSAILLQRLHTLLEQETTLGALQCDWIQHGPLWKPTPGSSVLRRRRRIASGAKRVTPC